MNDAAQLQMSVMANSPSSAGKKDKSWFEAMADAWGQALDNQANTITEMSLALEDGNDSPRQITLLTAESMRMQFLSNSSHTAIASIGSSLETMARKQ